MDSKVVLSICIPTYNRAEKLQQCLDHIVCQFEDENIKNSVEVVISDNASEDSTAQVVKKFQESFDNIQYFCNEKNLGIDENIINSVVKATGKYCWHIGDDDFIQNGALEFIVSFLSESNIALLTVDFHPFININRSLKKDASIREKPIIYSNTPEEFYKKGHCQGILGIFIFQRVLWLQVDRKNYEEHWSYYEIILKMLPSSNLKFAHLSYPALFIGQDYKWNENGTMLFTAIHIKRVFNKLKNFGYDKDFINNEVYLFARGLPMTLLAAKTSNLKCSFGNLDIIYKEFYNYPTQLFFVTLLFFIPNSFIKVLKFLRK